MAELRRLDPHDPLPDRGRFLLVMRRFGEDSPRLTLTELIASDGETSPQVGVPLGADGMPLDFEAAVQEATRRAERDDYATVYAVDRTAGPREREVLAHHGDHATGSAKLADTDPEDGETGSDLRDRPHDAGRNLRPDHAVRHHQGGAPSRAGITDTGSGADNERG